MKLNISLLKPDVRTFDDCLRLPTRKRSYKQIGSGQLGDATYRAYLAEPSVKSPPWAAFLDKHVDKGALAEVMNVNHAVAVLFEVKTSVGPRFFAITFGNGRHLIDREMIETNFGKFTALSLIAPGAFTMQDSKSPGMMAKQRRVAARGAPLRHLDHEPSIDVLRIVAGACTNGLAEHAEGADNLRLRVKDLVFDALGKKCSELHEVYRKEEYKIRYPDLQERDTVRDPRMRERLDEKLVSTLEARRNDWRISVVRPDQIDQRDSAAFKLIHPSGVAVVLNDDITLADVHRFLDDHYSGTKLKQDHLKRIKVLPLNDIGDPCGESASLLEYLLFEVELDGKTYSLSERTWYSMDDACLSGVNNMLAAIPRCDDPILLDWTKVPGGDNHDERVYNQLYAGDTDFLVLDRESFRGLNDLNARSQIEVADLFHWPTKKLFCVKRWESSASTNHHLAQGSVSAMLMREMPAYGREFLRQVKDAWPREPVPDDPHDLLKDLTFVYVLGVKPQRRQRLEELPALAKLNMRMHVQQIQARGFKVEIAWVPMV